MVTLAAKKKAALYHYKKKQFINKRQLIQDFEKGCVLPYASPVIRTQLFLSMNLLLRTLIRTRHRHLYYFNRGTLFPQGASWSGSIQTFRRSQHVLMVLAPHTYHIDMYHRTKTCQQKKGKPLVAVPHSIPVSLRASVRCFTACIDTGYVARQCRRSAAEEMISNNTARYLAGSADEE